MIKLKCQNCDCQYCYEITEKELLDNEHCHRKCLICGSKLIIANLSELVAQDLDYQAENYLNQWIKEMGMEGAVELIERSPRNGVRDMYMRKLKERGLIR
jgi:hypothetical protein